MHNVIALRYQESNQQQQQMQKTKQPAIKL